MFSYFFISINLQRVQGAACSQSCLGNNGANFLDGGMPGTAFRTDSEVHIIFLSDTRDQSVLSTAAMKAMLDARFPKQHVIVSGIVCPEGTSCGDDAEDTPGKYHELIRATGGVLGSIKVFNPTTVTPLYTAEAVGRGSLHSRAADALYQLVFGWL